MNNRVLMTMFYQQYFIKNYYQKYFTKVDNGENIPNIYKYLFYISKSLYFYLGKCFRKLHIILEKCSVEF